MILLIWCIYSNLLQPHIIEPSRDSNNCKPSLPDNIFLNEINKHVSSGNLYAKISDHIPNYIISEDIEYNIKTKNKMIIRDVYKIDEKPIYKRYKYD